MTTHYDTAIVGAGFSGLCVASRLKAAGFPSFVVLEKSDGVGGTWRDNSYPGAACDVPSMLYSLSCSPEWPWSRRYGTQAEILHYLRDFVARNSLASHLRYNSDVTQAQWDDVRGVWTVRLRGGEMVLARTLVLAMGGLHLPAEPAIEGLRRFRGRIFHSSQWEHGTSLQGKRVAVIGTGASAIQIVPEIAPVAGRLDVYQRTPAWILPRDDREISQRKRRQLQRWAVLRAASRFKQYVVQELLTLVLRKRGLAVAIVERAARAHLRAQLSNPALRKALTPSYALGCKRILLSSDYYPVFTRENVSLVTTPIAHLTGSGIVTSDGREHPADIIVLATGFKPNGFPAIVKIEGSGGESLERVWSDSPRTYLGISTRGFPNLFVMSGPNTGLGHNSVLLMIEAQADHIVGAHTFMRRSSCARLEVREDVQARYFQEIQRRLSRTVWQAGGCRSWYQSEHGANVALWPGISREYVRRARYFSPRAYTTSKPIARHA